MKPGLVSSSGVKHSPTLVVLQSLVVAWLVMTLGNLHIKKKTHAHNTH